MMSKKYKTKIYALLAIIFWSSAFVSTKIILQSHLVSPIDLGSLRYFFVAVLLLPMVFMLKLRIPSWKDLGKFTFSGFLGYTAYMYLFNTAITTINPSTASVINSICPGLTAIFAYFIFQEKIHKMGTLSLLISFIGIMILCLWNDKVSVNIGIIYMLGAAFCLSSYNITQRWFVKKYKPIEVIIYSLLTGSLLLILCNPFSLKMLPTLGITLWSHLIYLAIFPSIISYYCWTRAFSYCQETTEVTNFMFVTPLLTTGLSMLSIHERPEINFYIGGTCILLGMLLFQKTKKGYS